MREPCGRCCAIGVSVLLMYSKGRRRHLLLRSVTDRHAVGERLLHAVPSFMLESFTLNPADSISLRDQFNREYLEEVFQVSAVERPNARILASLEDDPEVRFLRRLEAEGSLTLRFTGIAVDLINLRPEICLLVRIETDEWYAGRERGLQGRNLLRIDAEVSAREPLPRLPDGRLLSIDLGEPPRFPGRLFQERFWAPAGRGAIALVWHFLDGGLEGA